QYGPALHPRAPPNAAIGLKAPAAAPPTILAPPASTQAWATRAPASRATPRQSLLATPRRRSIAWAASARGRQSAFIQRAAPIVSTDHDTQPISSTANRRRRRGGRFAQSNTLAGGRKRTASRATANMTAASTRYFRRRTRVFIGRFPDRPHAPGVGRSAFAE